MRLVKFLDTPRQLLYWSFKLTKVQTVINPGRLQSNLVRSGVNACSLKAPAQLNRVVGILGLFVAIAFDHDLPVFGSRVRCYLCVG